MTSTRSWRRAAPTKNSPADIETSSSPEQRVSWVLQAKRANEEMPPPPQARGTGPGVGLAPADTSAHAGSEAAALFSPTSMSG